MLSIQPLLRQRSLRWLGHVSRMPQGRTPKDTLYGELERGHRPIGRPALRFKDVQARPQSRKLKHRPVERLAPDRNNWRSCVLDSVVRGEETERHLMKSVEGNSSSKTNPGQPPSSSVVTARETALPNRPPLPLQTLLRKQQIVRQYNDSVISRDGRMPIYLPIL